MIWVKVVSRWSLIDSYDHRIHHSGKINIAEKEIEWIYERKYSNSHIWIWMFVKWFKKIGKWCYWIDYSKKSYCNWIHSKINFRTQNMIKLVIWTDLNAQSVCTYQLWCLLILWCSTWLEDSKDYKFVIFGCVKQKIWIKQWNTWVWINLKMNSNWLLKLWNFIAPLDSTLH
jgi:hypothetical protein